MSDLMRCIPFRNLIEQITEEANKEGSIFGILEDKFYKNKSNSEMALNFNEKIGSGTGPAAGPHTQLAQNIVASYLSGARFIELKTVQIMDGEAMRQAISKPCINAGDEGYNVEWSTELTVEEAMDEYIKAWFLCHILMKEYNLAKDRDFSFNMSCGYNLEGIKSQKIDSFLNGLSDASETKIFNECKEEIKRHLGKFKAFTTEDLEAVSPKVCSSLALSTMHGCPADEIEKIVSYLLTEKKLNVFLKCNPTLLGYEEARRILNDLGWNYIAFDESHFESDLKYDEAEVMLERLLRLADESGVHFGVKLTNTFPVQIKNDELPGEEMYSSGRVLLPLSVHVAEKLAKSFGNRLPMAYSGGADALNIKGFIEAGILPVTVCTTLLKPGGYERLKQIAEATEAVLKDLYTGPDAEKITKLREEIMGDERNHKAYREAEVSRKGTSDLPMFDCYIAPCKEEGCPIGQEIPTYLNLIDEEKYKEAFEVILKDNALPNILGEICYHPCTKKCTRVDYDKSLDIRGMKKLANDRGYNEVLDETVKPAPNGKTVLVIGAGVQGLSTAYYLAREGFDVTIAESKDKPFGILNNIMEESGLTQAAMDKDLLLIKRLGVKLMLSVKQDELKSLGTFDYVVSSTGKNEGFEDALVIKKDKTSRLQAVYAMAYAKEAAGEISSRVSSVDTNKTINDLLSTDTIYSRKGILMLPSKGKEEAGRCLNCDTVCEVCTEVCPNRANVAIRVEGFNNVNQILHLDYLCNECGNCETFCPHGEAPYKKKFTLFATEEDFNDSENAGIFIVEDNVIHARYGDGSIESANADNLKVENFRKMTEAITKEYSYLILTPGGAL